MRYPSSEPSSPQTDRSPSFNPAEQKLALLVQRNPLAVIEWNAAFEVVDWNPAAEQIFGYSKAEALGQKASQLIVPVISHADVKQKVEELVVHKGGVRSTHTNITKDGRLILCEWYNTPLLDDNDVVTGAISMAQDITEREQTLQDLQQAQIALKQSKEQLEERVEERTSRLQETVMQLEGMLREFGIEFRDRKQAQTALRQRENTYLALLEAIPDLILQVDGDGTCIDYMRAKNFLAYHDRTDWRGKPLTEFMPLDLAQKRLSYIRRALQTGELQLYEQDIVVDGVIKSEEVRIVISGANETLIIVRDITDRKRSEAEQKRAEEELTRSQQLLQLVIDSIPHGVYWKDRELVYLGCNGYVANMVGLDSPRDIVGKTDYDLAVPRAQSDHYRAADLRVMASNQAELHVIEQQAIADGTQIWIDANKLPLHDADGQVVGILGTYEDISDRKQAEEQIKTSQQFLNSVLDGISDPVFVKDEDHRWVLLNRAYCDLKGVNRDQLIGQLDLEFSSPSSAADWLSDHNHVSEDYYVGADGRVRFLSTKTSCFYDAAGHKFLVGTIRDLSDRKQMEDTLRQSEVRLRQQASDLEEAIASLQRAQTQLIQSEKMSSLGQLVAGVAHEINNPVSFIYGNLNHANRYIRDLLELIEGYQTHYPEPVAEIKKLIKAIDLPFLIRDLPKLLNSMQVGADRIEEIVRSLRTFSHMDEAEKKAVDIHQGIDSTLMILQNRLKEQATRPEILIQKDYGDIPLVECYAGQLNQVFMNIISNGIDALEEQIGKRIDGQIYPEPIIIIRTELIHSEAIAIRIIDNGMGIPEDARQRIFDPFFTTKSVGKGTGMGLSISHQIVTDKHGGRLQCQSSLGQGAEFIIEIPIRLTHRNEEEGA